MSVSSGLSNKIGLDNHCRDAHERKRFMSIITKKRMIVTTESKLNAEIVYDDEIRRIFFSYTMDAFIVRSLRYFTN